VADLWRYRGLVRLLVTRDLTVRYKRSLLGVSWTVLNPLLMTMVMWFVFSALFRFKIPNHVPYVVYLLSGILAVTFLQQGVSMTGASMVSASNVLTKVYVPPVVFAFSAACGGAINFLFGLVPLLVIQLSVGVGIPWTIVLVPLPLLLLLTMIAGLGMIIAVLAIQFVDVIDLTNVLLFLVGYLTPTFYPITIIPAHLRRFMLLNPLVSFVDMFRHLEYGGSIPPPLDWSITIASAVVSLTVGLLVFVRRWPTLAARL
jgi:ABC-type polysaccharide/polyol phosphate export permease